MREYHGNGDEIIAVACFSTFMLHEERVIADTTGHYSRNE